MTREDVYEALVSELTRGLTEITYDLSLLRARWCSNGIGTKDFVELSNTLREREHQKLQMLERLYHPESHPESTRWDKIREG